MPAPLVGAAVAVAARLAAKKAAQEAAKKTAKKAASKTTDKIAKNSVKTVPARGEAVNTTMNRLSDVIVKNMKSGRLAKEMSKDVNSITKGTIKINSAPAKSANAAKKAADAKTLKAANKKKK